MEDNSYYHRDTRCGATKIKQCVESRHRFFVFLLIFYFTTYHNMQQAKRIKNSTNVRRFGEKVTHRYNSVDAPNFVFTPEGSPKASIGAKLYLISAG
jgi:hypothetical protein